MVIFALPVPPTVSNASTAQAVSNATWATISLQLVAPYALLPALPALLQQPPAALASSDISLAPPPAPSAQTTVHYATALPTAWLAQ